MKTESVISAFNEVISRVCVMRITDVQKLIKFNAVYFFLHLSCAASVITSNGSYVLREIGLVSYFLVT